MKSQAQMGRFITFVLLLHMSHISGSSNPIHSQPTVADSLSLAQVLKAAMERARAHESNRTSRTAPDLVFRLVTPE